MSDGRNNAAGNDVEKDYTWRAFVVAASLVLLVQAVVGVIIYQLGFTLDGDAWALRGQFGDMFGAGNALFSGLAFAGVIIAVILQKNELALQRRELSASVEAQQGSRESLAEQVGMLERSSRLSAIATLISAYGRELTVIDQTDQPIQDKLSSLRSDLERNQEGLEYARTHQYDHDVPQFERTISEIRDEIERFEVRANQNENMRAEARQKHERLIAELERVVEEAEEAKRKQSAR